MQMTDWRKLELYSAQHYQDLRQAADRARLARQARAGDGPLLPAVRRMLCWLGLGLKTGARRLRQLRAYGGVHQPSRGRA